MGILLGQYVRSDMEICDSFEIQDIQNVDWDFIDQRIEQCTVVWVTKKINRGQLSKLYQVMNVLDGMQKEPKYQRLMVSFMKRFAIRAYNERVTRKLILHFGSHSLLFLLSNLESHANPYALYKMNNSAKKFDQISFQYRISESERIGMDTVMKSGNSSHSNGSSRKMTCKSIQIIYQV